MDNRRWQFAWNNWPWFLVTCEAGTIWKSESESFTFHKSDIKASEWHQSLFVRKGVHGHLSNSKKLRFHFSFNSITFVVPNVARRTMLFHLLLTTLVPFTLSIECLQCSSQYELDCADPVKRFCPDNNALSVDFYLIYCVNFAAAKDSVIRVSTLGARQAVSLWKTGSDKYLFPQLFTFYKYLFSQTLFTFWTVFLQGILDTQLQ